MQYRVRTFRPGGKQVQVDLLNAVDETTLRAQVQARGDRLLSVDLISNSHSVRSSWHGLRLQRKKKNTSKSSSFPLFCREIKTLILAGMTIVEAVQTLSVKERLEGADDSLAARVLSGLEQGQPLSKSLEQLDQCPPVLIAAVRAGEHTSSVGESLGDYLRYHSMVEALRRKVISASIYPLLVTILGVAISLFLLMVVMPNFAAMYENLRGAGESASSWVINLSQFAAKYRYETLSGVVMLVFVMWRAWRDVTLRRGILSWICRFPGIAPRIADFQLAMTYQALSLLLKGGYAMTDAMRVAADSTLSAWLRTRMSEARLRVEQGGSVSQALADMELCDEVGRRLMAAAQRNGDFHLASDVVSRQFAERFELFVERTTRIVEPVLLMLVALVVGTLVVLMYLPIFQMAHQF